MSIATIKAAIDTNLAALVTEEVLAGHTVTDIKKSPLNADVGRYPHAFLMPPSVESEVLDNRSIVRTYSFDIMVLYRAEDISDTADLETSIEDILTVFDNDPTLGGTCLAGALPVSSAPEPFQHNGRDLIMVVLRITGKEIVSLTFG
jgi:hypothetical protein